MIAKNSGRPVTTSQRTFDPGPGRVGEERAQQLDHAAAAVGRVDVPDRSALEQLPCVAHCGLDLGPFVAQRGAKALDRERLHRNLEGGGHRGSSIWAVEDGRFGGILDASRDHETEGVGMSEERRTTIEEARRVGDEIGVDWDRFDLEQFRAGMDVEFEHGSHDPQTDVTGDDPITTGKIALAHMKEFPDYYERLERMEKEAERDWADRG